MPIADSTKVTSAPTLEPRFKSESQSGGPRDDGQDRSSTRRLDSVGVETILGAMIEQKRKSQPAVEEIRDDGLELDALDDETRTPSERERAASSHTPSSDSYLKVR